MYNVPDMKIFYAEKNKLMRFLESYDSINSNSIRCVGKGLPPIPRSKIEKILKASNDKELVNSFMELSKIELYSLRNQGFYISEAVTQEVFSI
ncbi:MAG: hypothetical protein RSB67_01660 [Clostridia bacterium]